VELQSRFDEIEGRGLGLVAILYDPPATIKAFTGAHDIEFPVLSDEGSEVIRRYDLKVSGAAPPPLNVVMGKMGGPPNTSELYGLLEDHRRNIGFPGVHRVGATFEAEFRKHTQLLEESIVVLVLLDAGLIGALENQVPESKCRRADIACADLSIVLGEDTTSAHMTRDRVANATVLELDQNGGRVVCPAVETDRRDLNRLRAHDVP